MRVCLPFASWRAGAGAARTGPNVRRRGGEATHRPERAARARAGRQLRRCRRRAGRWFRRRDLAARSFASWGRGGTAGGFAVSVPVTSPLGGPVPRPGRRASARPSGYASRYGAGVHAAGLFVSLSRVGLTDRWGEIRIGPPAAGRRESLRAALRPSRISVHGSYSAGDVGRVRPPPRRLVPAPVRTAAPRFLTISTAIFSTYSPSGWTQHAGHVDTGSEYHAMLPPRARAGLHGATRCSPLLRGTARNPTCG